jgi:hypothetical protein
MDTLPNELLLKIFGKVDWEYQIENPLNVICQKWNNLIKKHGIDFDTDYNLELTIRISDCSFLYDPPYKINLIDNKMDISINENGDCNIYLLEKLLLKIPAYKLKLEINYKDFIHTSDLIKFQNKHLKVVFFYDYFDYYNCNLNKMEHLLIYNSYHFPKDYCLGKFITMMNLKDVCFVHIEIDLDLVDFIKKADKLIKIKFLGCWFSWSKEYKLSDIFYWKQFKENSSILFEECTFTKNEFNINGLSIISVDFVEEPYDIYVIKQLMFRFKNNVWILDSKKTEYYNIKLWPYEQSS